ncbi:hypothetical protein Poly30_37240 [Planctomycetes bacterium Poly30]|uniref:Uncharacterized protein n=1 Tax=Saltatorellus ferox TaxID=2528018 RepID=A0A518EVV5_9BACT|nr:hypothetical protein Poly30_37240 [Planctomycetes bacterium Poly30]
MPEWRLLWFATLLIVGSGGGKGVALASIPVGTATFVAGADEEGVQPEDLTVGHWVTVKGTTGANGVLLANSVEVSYPKDEQEIIGTVTETRKVDDADVILVVDGQPAFVGPKARLRGVDVSRLRKLKGSRVSIEGYWRSPAKFSVRELEVRSKGRDRLEGRIDAITRGPEGLELRVMGRTVVLLPEAELEASDPLDSVTLADPTEYDDLIIERRIDDDDDIPGRRIAPDLWGGVRLEWQRSDQRNFDLDDSVDADRVDDEYSVRGELRWVPSPRFFGLVEYRHGWRDRFEEDDGSSAVDRGRLNEAHVYWRDVLIKGLDLQIGRQDFDEEREWLYDENLDAVRAFVRRYSMRLELFAAGIIAGGSPRDEDVNTYGAILSTETSADWSVGAYAIRRDSDLGGARRATHLGLRGLGEFVDDHESWAELSFLTGQDSGNELTGWAYDFGDVWYPPWAEDWYIVAGLAYGSGDRGTFDGKDATFRQTGLHDNNAKFGGVTSFRYYGELFQPELANMRISTLAVGRRFGKRESIDLVFHRYDQDFARPFLVDADLREDPNGLSTNLGWEVDLVLGSRSLERANFELVFGRFEPGDAFPDADHAWIMKAQVRLQL